ncbi:S8 family serine peptidase [Luteimonas vadosa]|uniref:Protease domain-containing protein n=1 Tax=Luteimonas vadosa TaxID=1165507 RepID=A0ABP9E4I5_9GAMM
MSIRFSGLKAAFAVAALTVVAGVSAQSGPAKPATSAAEQAQKMHIVMFREAPLATYGGEISGLPAAPRYNNGKRAGRIDVKSAAAAAYVGNLKKRQQQHEREIASDIGRSLNIHSRMQHAVNAIVVDLSPVEAAQLKRSTDIMLVEAYHEYVQDTDAGPALIGAPAVWANGTGLPPGLRTDETGPAQGEGIVFGILDSGINFNSPSFAAIDGYGYQHTNPLGAGTFLGACAPGGIDDGACNDKLIGGYDFVCGAPANTCNSPATILEEPSFVDNNGHGSHTAGTAAGNQRDATFRGAPVHISGVAPRANIVAYDICYTRRSDGNGLCPNVSAVAAVNQSIADGVVDVINYSIGGGASPWTESVSIAFLNATDAGIYIAASAGNSGPGASTLGHNEPWVASTAAATHDRLGFDFPLSVTGPAPVPAALATIYATPGVSSVPHTTAIPGTTPLVVSAGINTANDGCNAFAAGTFQSAIAVIRRGSCAFSIKTNNAAAAGAIAVVIANNGAGGLSPSVPGTTIPAFGITQVDGDALASFASGKTGLTGGIGYPAVPSPGVPDVLASFSSRGPAAFDVLKPDLTAPGVQILAAYAGPPDALAMINGTSMSSPHQAGAAGLLRQLHPTWSVPELKSALALTATQGVLLEDGVTPAGPFARGSGRVQVDAAARAGLVMHETADNYYLAYPGFGGVPSSLNQPSMANGECRASCSFTRVFRSTRKNSQSFLVSLEGLNGSVSLGKFNVKAFRTQTLRVTIDSSQLPIGAWSFGTLVLTPEEPGNNSSPTLRLPIAVKAAKVVLPLLEVGNLSLQSGQSQFFPVNVPAGASSLVVKTVGPNGDADIIVRNPSSVVACTGFSASSNEACTIANPVAGAWNVELAAFAAFTGVTLTVGYTQ